VIDSKSKEKIKEVKELLSKPYSHLSSKYEDGELVYFTEEVESIISFWNLIKPDDSIIEQYAGKEKIENVSDMDNPNYWYNWNINNWGTKWDACNEEISFENETQVEYIFDTAWDVPLPFYNALAKKFPEVHIYVDYEIEGGNNGNLQYKNGDLISESSWENNPFDDEEEQDE
jgi:hypothetical protein